MAGFEVPRLNVDIRAFFIIIIKDLNDKGQILATNMPIKWIK